jgi:ABC-type polysaccharide/polyol phosphate transport system ATPase subunit
LKKKGNHQVCSDLAFALRGVDAAVGTGFALRNVSFELPTGYVMGLIGANGAGKTSTIRCLLGMREIDAGEIELLGHRVPGPVALRQDVAPAASRPDQELRRPPSLPRAIPGSLSASARPICARCSPP